MQITSFALSLLPFLGSAAVAGAPDSYCRPLAEISTVIEYCYQNEHYVSQADACLQKFDSDVTARGQSLAGSFSANASGSIKAQNSKLGNAVKDLSDTTTSLDALISEGLRARQELVGYRGALLFSGNPSMGFLLHFGLLGDHQRDPCYRENYEGLNARITALDKKLQELHHARLQAKAFRSTDEASRRNLDQNKSLGAQAAAKRPAAQGSAVPSGNSPRKNSTITGEIKKPILK